MIRRHSVVFDRAADFYDHSRAFPPGEEAAVAAMMARVGGLSPASRVLEIGVGTGRIALPLAPYTGEFYGVDLSQSMMARLRAKQNGEQVHLSLADAAHLPFPDHSFDAVVVVHVFHLVASLEGVISELARVLKPGAPLLHGRNQMDRSIAELRSAWQQVVDSERLSASNWGRPVQVLHELGWRQDGLTREHRFTHEFVPQQAIEGFRQRLWSSTWALTDDEIERGAAVMEAMARSRYDDPAQPVMTTSAFCVDVYNPPAGPDR
ncbi:MAG: class I SAM-dependent methyltransferase [Phototrophicaceae bacterium]